MPETTKRKSVFNHAALNMPEGAADAYTKGFSVHTFMTEEQLAHYRRQSRSDFIAIVLVTEGELVCKVNLRECVARKNNVVLLSPGQVKQLVHLEPGTRISMLSFTPGFITAMGFPKQFSELVEYLSSATDQLWELESGDMRTLMVLLRQLSAYTKQTSAHNYGKELLYHQFSIFLYEMAGFRKKYTQRLTAVVSRKENLLLRFSSLVKKHYKKQRSVLAYARQLHVTAKYLSATVKELTGQTAGEMIDEQVLLEARYCLHDPDTTIAEIAHHLNFPDPSVFGKFFKRHTGVTPMSYRRQQLM
ncbi:MAG TPA: helix-turn-helix domain-containing protein [Chitinophagaceae bacterium]|nr:helix-turn-helix domain-containing protein [Chitinophagaceae bacterium]HPH32516.1 helix-turn-helix domain-containing protein [Chitinophagaceae bacterium]HPN59893.1 helix-turn-helix domain-containing protein [Chitinophagaceae bacterium]